MISAEEARLKRLKIRCWRRGTKEMDLILGGFADKYLTSLSGPDLDALEALMEENDQDLYQWVSGQSAPPDQHAPMIARIAGEFGAV